MNIVIFHANIGGMPFELLPKHVDMVREAMPGADIYITPDGKDLMDKGIQADIIIGWGSGQISEDYLRFCDHVQWINCLSAGVEAVMASKVVETPGIQITNTSGIHGVPISEHVMGFLVSHFRGLPRIRDNMKQHLWQKFMGDEIYGRTICIVGAGSIGTAIAKRCKAFGLHVIGIKRTPAELPDYDEVLTNDHLDKALSRADIVVQVTPYTPATHHMFDAARFDKIKPGAVFVNVGRGKTVDTDALTKALQAGKLSAAMLDALDPEPLPADHPLWDMENVLISPHMSADSPRYYDRAFAIFQENAAHFLKKEPMRNAIDLVAKY